MLSNYYHKDIGMFQKNGLFSGEWDNRFIVQKKSMKEDIKIIKLRVEKVLKKLNLEDFEAIRNLVKYDYFYMKYVLVKLNKNNYDFRWNILGILSKFKKEFIDVDLGKELYYHFDYLERLYSFWNDECHYYINFVKEFKIVLNKIYNDEESDFLELENQLNNIINIDYKLIKFRKRYISKFTHCLQRESQLFKILVNKEAKHEVFENVVLPLEFITYGSKNEKNDEKIDMSLKDQVTLIEKQFEDKKALLTKKIKYFEEKNNHNVFLFSYFDLKLKSLDFKIFLEYIEYNINFLKLNEIELNARIKCIEQELEFFSIIFKFINKYEEYLLRDGVKN